MFIHEKFSVSFNQLPVGQGNFAFGQIHLKNNNSDKSIFTWVYDCGSSNWNYISREVNHFPEKEIDILFISHFDKDHANGISELNLNRKINEVVIPYLSEWEKIIQLAKVDMRGMTDEKAEKFVTLVTNPETFFKNSKITFLFNNEKLEFSEIESLSTRDSVTEEDKTIKHYWKTTSYIDTSENVVEINGDSYIEVKIIDKVVCRLIPFNCKVSILQINSLIKKLNEIDPTISITDSKSILNYISNNNSLSAKEKLKKIKKAYSAITSFKKHNDVSLCLLAEIHIAKVDTNQNFKSYICSDDKIIKKSISWFSTGDYNLKERNLRDKFYNYYSRFRKNDVVFTLPHHGSNLSFDVNEYSKKFIVCGQTFISSAGTRNSYGHPSKPLLNQIKAHGGKIIEINEKSNLNQFIYDI